jgi:predicted TIM-barrel fold metal-dependent hydrolase
VIFSQQPDLYGCPRLADRHWDRIWAAAEEMGLSVNFHTGSGDSTLPMLAPDEGRHTNYAVACAQIFMGNAQAISSVIGGGICHRFPRLKLVSVESGVGWIPFLLQGLDWMWKESGVATTEHPEYDLLPSEYFKRQMYGCFWFEHENTLTAAIEYLGEDHVLYETDFPHATSMSPGPASSAVPAREFIATYLNHLPASTLRKVLHDNAATLYQVS